MNIFHVYFAPNALIVSPVVLLHHQTTMLYAKMRLGRLACSLRTTAAAATYLLAQTCLLDGCVTACRPEADASASAARRAAGPAAVCAAAVRRAFAGGCAAPECAVTVEGPASAGERCTDSVEMHTKDNSATKLHGHHDDGAGTGKRGMQSVHANIKEALRDSSSNAHCVPVAAASAWMRFRLTGFFAASAPALGAASVVAAATAVVRALVPTAPSAAFLAPQEVTMLPRVLVLAGAAEAAAATATRPCGIQLERAKT